MKSKRSRLAFVGLLALVTSVTIGLLGGSVANAAKKKSKRSFTVTKTAPTVVPGAPGPNVVVSKIPVGTVAKKVAPKGKVVSLNGVTATTTLSGSPGFADDVQAQLLGPSGRTAGLINPLANDQGGGNNETVSGPLTETPNSAVGPCIPETPAPPPPCADPDNTLLPPYAGTVGNQGLLNFSGSNPRGTWFIKVFNTNPDPVTLSSAKVTGGLIAKPQ
jgi:hypothetical protein